MPIVNGINYNEKFITDEELAVVEAMRLGADVDINFHNLEELDQVDEGVNLFADFPKEGRSWIHDKKDSIGYSYISFFKQMGKINVACYLDIEEVTPPTKQ